MENELRCGTWSVVLVLSHLIMAKLQLLPLQSYRGIKKAICPSLPIDAEQDSSTPGILLSCSVSNDVINVYCFLAQQDSIIWKRSYCLGFLLPLNISSSVSAIHLKFCRCIGTYQLEVVFNYGPDQKSNMAARWPPCIFISAQYLK